VNEELLAKGVAKLYKASGGTSPSGTGNAKKQGAKVASTTADANLGAKEGSIKRVLLVKDRRTDESWRYGFAEFASAEVFTNSRPMDIAQLTSCPLGVPSSFDKV
jgi:hypothetical protein